ncbi:hypothetical protein PM082_018436 [Marasmius tenuissimus]|nr:hypothetical protein PM082_018436 [Marasmius tenuissimus]
MPLLEAFQQSPDPDKPDKFFLDVALDLFSGLTQGLGDAYSLPGSSTKATRTWSRCSLTQFALDIVRHPFANLLMHSLAT